MNRRSEKKKKLPSPSSIAHRHQPGPICYVDLSQQGMGVALLSCGHAFHHCCVESFESFQTSKDDLKCPVCRQGPYQRKMWRFRGGGCRLKLDGTGCAEAGC